MGWIGSMPDYALAQQWYAKAKDHYAPAAVASGYVFDTVDNRYQQAATDYALAVKQGDTVGQFNLGLLYEKGKGRPVDLDQAKALYLAAAEKGHVQSMVQLAGLYLNPQSDDADPETALRWYQKAAEKGDREALYQMGLLSETGVELKLNYADAVRYYKEAALKDNDKAKLALARMYQYGLGLPKNNEEAARIYQDLASKQNAFAQYQLALLNYDGVLGDKNLSKAKQLLQEAVNNGSLQASKTLLRINAQSEEQKSFIEPLMLNMPKLADQSANLMYFNALSAWNRGDEEFSRIILGDLLLRYPDYGPAKYVYEQLNEKSSVASGQDSTSNVAKSV
ncbi:MAG: tetratricopeptide repeat protein [Legionellaceae bacterium]